MEIRSYRRVFDLERRIYTIDRLRLNPSGVPARVLVYAAVATVSFVLVGHLPLLGRAAGVLPWYVWDFALPCASAAALGVLRIDGRGLHLVALAAVRYRLGPLHLAAMRRSGPPGRRWRPDELLLLPDGSEGRMRRLLYRGPGAVAVARGHHLEEGARAGSIRRRLRRPTLGLRESPCSALLDTAEVIVLHDEASLLVTGAVRARG